MSKRSVDRRRRIFWVVACGLLSTPLIAGDSPWYVAGRFGQVASERNLGPANFGWTVDDEDVAASVEVGYGLHRHLAVQAGYHDLGSHRGTPRPCPPTDPCPLSLAATEAGLLLPLPEVQAELSGYSLALVPRWPVGERVSLYGKVGYIEWDAEVTRPSDGRPVDDFSAGELLLGAGARYEFSSGLGLLLELEDFELARVVSVGASWRF